MRLEDWETLSGWLSEWSSADSSERERLRAQLAVEHPDLIQAADALSTASVRLAGVLETPAVLLAAGDLANEVEEALASLRDAVDGRDLFVTFVGVDPKWDGLRDVPAFRTLVARASLLEVSDRARY
jgi:hypothetical protein